MAGTTFPMLLPLDTERRPGEALALMYPFADDKHTTQNMSTYNRPMRIHTRMREVYFCYLCVCVCVSIYVCEDSPKLFHIIHLLIIFVKGKELGKHNHRKASCS